MQEITGRYIKNIWCFLKQNKQLPDSKEIRILRTNTKVRRLGYFKLLADFFSNQGKIPQTIINRKFENFAALFNDELIEYKNPKGLIKTTKNGISAQPYIELAKDIGFLNLLNRVYTPGKLLKVYIQLKSEFTFSNTFDLSKLDKIFFGEQILKNDFLYINLILETIYNLSETNYAELRANFQDYLLKRLDEYKKQNLGIRRLQKALLEIDRVIERVRGWDKPEKYLEHVLMPRLNWLFDLELIRMDKKLNLTLTNSGRLLSQHICYWSDINAERILTPDSFLDIFTIHLFDHIYGGDEHLADLLGGKQKIVNQKMVQYLKESFKHFHTLAPNRVTASQAIMYVKYKLYLRDDLKIGAKHIMDYLENKSQTDFIFKFQKEYNDGYIQEKILKGVAL